MSSGSHEAIGLGVLLALVTSVSWAAGNVLTQRVGKRVGPPRAMLWSLAAGAVMAAPCALLFDTRPAPLTLAIAAWVAAAALSGVLAYVGLFFALTNEGLTVAVPVVSAWPLVAGVVSVALLGEVLLGSQILAAAAVLLGVVLVALPRPAVGPTPSRWALRAAFASALGFGVMVPAMGRIAPATGAFGATVVVFVLGILLSLVVGRVAAVDLRAPPRAAWGLVLATGAAETIGFVALVFARRFAPMALVAPVASLASTLTVLYAWIVLGERPRRLAIAGALISGAGLAILAS